MKLKNIIFLILVGIHFNSISVFASSESWLTMPQSKEYDLLDDGGLGFDVSISEKLIDSDSPKGSYDKSIETFFWGPLHTYAELKVGVKLDHPDDIDIIKIEFLSRISKKVFHTIVITPSDDAHDYLGKIIAKELPISSTVDLKVSVKDFDGKWYEKISKVHTYAMLDLIANLGVDIFSRFGIYSVIEDPGIGGGCFLHIRTFNGRFPTRRPVYGSGQMKAELVGTDHVVISGAKPSQPWPDIIDVDKERDNIIPMFQEANPGGGTRCFTAYSSHYRTYDFRLTSMPSEIDGGEGFIEETYTKHDEYLLGTDTLANNRWVICYFHNARCHTTTWYHSDPVPDS